MSRRSLSSTLISRLQELIKDARDLEQEEEEIGQKRESILQEIAQVEKNHERAMKDLRSKSRTRLSEIDAEIGTKEDAIKVLQQEIEELQRRKNGIVADDHDQELEVIQQDTNQRVSELELELKAFDEQLEKNRAKQEGIAGRFNVDDIASASSSVDSPVTVQQSSKAPTDRDLGPGDTLDVDGRILHTPSYIKRLQESHSRRQSTEKELPRQNHAEDHADDEIPEPTCDKTKPDGPGSKKAKIGGLIKNAAKDIAATGKDRRPSGPPQVYGLETRGCSFSERYPVVVFMNGAWHELACLVCKANTPSGSEKLFQNVGRLLAHVTNCHGQQPGKTREEKLEGCIQRTCDKEDLERLRNDKYEILYTSGDEPLRKSRPWAIEASDASGKSESKSEVSKEPNLEGSPALPSRIQGAQESTAPPNANEPVRKDSIGQVQRKCTHAQVLDSSSGIPNNTDSKMSSEGKQSTNFGSTTSSDNARRDSGGRSVTGKEMYEPNVFSTAGGSPGPDQATRDPRFQGRTLKPQQMLPRSRAELNLAAIAAFNSSAPHAPHAPSPTPDQAPAGQGRSQHINRQSTPKSTGASESLGFPARVVTSGLVSSPSQPLMKRHCGEDGGNDELRSLPARRLRIAPGRRPSLLLQAPVQANQALDEKR